MKPELVLASGNPGKLREFRELLTAHDVEIVGLDAFPELAFPEEGRDYAANAEAKARTAAVATGLPALADDSGLEVDALGGRPGPLSARYGGPGLDDAGRVERLLEELRDVPDAERGARFVCVAALALPDGEVHTGRGECPGRILATRHGDGGFGYDPVFLPDGHRHAMAELPAAQKNRISHRARALEALAPRLRVLLQRRSRAGSEPGASPDSGAAG